MSPAQEGSTSQEQVATPGLPRVLREFWIGSVVVFLLMFVVGYVRFRAGAPQAHYNPIFSVHFTDLLEYLPTFRLLHTAAFFHPAHANPVAYPPFGAIFYRLLYATGHPVRAYITCALLWLAVMVTGAARWLLRQGLAPVAAWLFPLTVLGLSFPFLGLVCYGNIELFLWMFAALGTWMFVRDRPNAAAMLWGCAAAMKLYPFIFLLLPLCRKQGRAVLCGIGSFLVATLAALLYLGPTVRIAALGSLHNVFGYQGQRVGEWTMHEVVTNHSAFTLVKLALRIAGRPFAEATVPYYVCATAIFAAVFVLRVRTLPLANQLLALTTFMLLFPTISYFHTLVHLAAPLALLLALAVDAERSGETISRLRGTILLFLPLLGSFMLLTERRLFLFGGLIQGVLLLRLFYVAVRFPLVAGGQTSAETEAAVGYAHLSLAR